jgi:cytoskeletal protein CcmA (bactofilin family)
MNLYQPTITGSLSVSGSVIVDGSITANTISGTLSGTASLATTASYAVVANSASYAASASNALAAQSASYVLNAVSSSYILNAQSASIATTALTASSADNFLVRNTLTAQTLVVQTITSSVDFVTGSTRFGSVIDNTHEFTGSVLVTGSTNINGNAVVTGSLKVNKIGINVGDLNLDNFSTLGLIVSGSIGFGNSGGAAALVDRDGSGNTTFYGGSGDIRFTDLTMTSNYLTIKNAGNVGIGTADPGYKLDVNGTGRFTDALSGTSADFSGNNHSLASNNTLRFTDTDTATEANQQIGKIEFYSSDSSTPGAGVKAYIGAFAQDTTPDAYLSFATQDGSATPNPVERLRISSEGAATFSATVSSGGAFKSYIPGQTALRTYTKEATVEISSYQSDAGSPYTKTTDIVANADSGVASQMRLLTTTSGGTPTTALTIASTGAATFSSSVTATGNNANIFQGAGATTGYQYGSIQNSGGNFLFGVAGSNGSFWGDGNGGAYFSTIGTTTATNFVIATNNAGRMTITSGGNVGIGTSTSYGKLTVQGPTLSSSSETTYGLWVSDAGTIEKGIVFGYNSTLDIGQIQAVHRGVNWKSISMLTHGGELCIGTATGGYKLTLNGQPGANGYTAWTNYSDLRLKENITDLESANILDKICSIRPVTFNYNELSGYDEATRSRRISGFIAQELMEVFPDMVGTIIKNEVEYYDTNLSNLNLYLVKAIQEQQAQIEELKAEFDVYKTTHP